MVIFKGLLHAFRIMKRHPAFTIAATLTLGLAIATTVNIFEVVDAVILRALHVHDPSSLVILEWHQRKPLPTAVRQQWSGFEESKSFSYPFFKVVEQSGLFAGTFGFTPIDTSFSRAKVDGREVFPRGEAVTGGYFSILGVQSALGHLISNETATPSSSPVLNISYAFWMKEFGGNPAVLGKTISFHHVPYTIVGVTPESFSGTESGQAPDFWVPVQQWSETIGMVPDPTNWGLTIMARRKPQIDIGSVRSQMEVVFKNQLRNQMAGQFNADDIPELDVVPARRGVDLVQNELGQPTKIIALIGILVFFIAAANVGILMLARALSRDQEIAVRLSLGASRESIVAQFFIESTVIAITGGLLGSLLAHIANVSINNLFAQLTPATDINIIIAPRLLSILFGAAAIVLAAILCGTIPAYYASTKTAPSAIKGNGNARMSRRWKMGDLLVAAQLSFAVLLVLISGLLIRTVQNLEHQDLGFNPNRLLIFSVNAAKSGYRGVALSDFYQRVQERIATLPGIESVSSSTTTLGSTTALAMPISFPGIVKEGPLEPTFINLVGPNYFSTMEIPVLRGRGLVIQDMGSSNKIAVINQAMVDQYFKHENPIGKRFALGPIDQFEIAGVVRNVKGSDLRGGFAAQIYVPFTAMPANLQSSQDGISFEVRTKNKPELLAPSLRDAVASLDSKVRPSRIITQMDQVGDAAVIERTLSKTASFFGILVLLLTVISVYSMQSYAVVRRTREIGIRISVGATRPAILRLVLQRFLIVLLPGLVIGLCLGVSLGKMLSKELYQVQSTDYLTALLSICVVSLACFLGGIVPAQMAASVDPVEALRYE